MVPFGRELYIEREDFMEEPPRKYFRLFPGNEVRLMSAYFVTCTGFEKDENGNVTVVHATYDPATKSGSGFCERKVKGTIHWVAAETAKQVEVRPGKAGQEVQAGYRDRVWRGPVKGYRH